MPTETTKRVAPYTALKTEYTEHVRNTLAKAKDTRDELMDLYRYLTSDKFFNDPTVQVADVLRRLQPVIEGIGYIVEDQADKVIDLK